MLGIGLIALPVMASDGVHLHETLEHYPIDGDNARQWHAAMQVHGPRDLVSGRAYSGFTRWYVTWSWDTYPLKDGECQVGGYQVRIELKMQLPEWTGRSEASAGLRREWGALYGRLRDHEDLHRANALAAAHALDGMLADMDEPIPCAGSRKRIDRAARDLLSRFHEADRRLDRETRHGRIAP